MSTPPWWALRITAMVCAEVLPDGRMEDSASTPRSPLAALWILFFIDRNDNGVTIGVAGSVAGTPFSLLGSTFTPLTVTIRTITHSTFSPTRINKWGTIVDILGMVLTDDESFAVLPMSLFP